MSWDAISAIAELIGAVGVVASLFYLGTQIRQNTRSLRASSYNAVVTNLSHLAEVRGGDGRIADLFVRGQTDIHDLDPTEQRQFALLMMSMFRHYENIFYQFSEHMIDAVVWAGWKHRITRYFWQPGVQDWWPTWRDDCHPDFREFLESSIPPDAPSSPLFLDDATEGQGELEQAP